MPTDKRQLRCFLCVVVLSVSVTSTEATNDSLTEDVYDYMTRTLPQLCPNEPLCYRNATTPVVAGSRRDCCRPCSCREHCHLAGNCCPDKRPPKTREAPVGGALSADMFHCVYAESHANRDSLAYHMVAKCPDNSNAPVSQQSKCEDAPTTELKATIPISDPESNIIYRNSYCSLCHNKTGIPWTASLHCNHRSLTASFTAIGSSSAALRYCNAVLSPPPGHSHTADTCVPKVFVCKTTGLWASPGVESALIEEACSTFTVPFTGQRPFPNIYCHICQMGWPKETCEPGRSERADSSAFTVFLKYSADDTDETEADEIHGDELCLGETIMDTHTGRCRPLFCPQFKKHVGGRCVSFVENYSDMKMLMILELVTDDFQSLKQESKRTKLAVARQYLKFLIDERADMAFTLRDVAETPEEFPAAPYLAVVALISTTSVPEPDIRQLLDDRLDRSFSHTTATGGSFTFRASLNMKIHIGYFDRRRASFSHHRVPSLTDLSANSTLVSLYQKEILETDQFQGEVFTHLLFCPQVKLNETEFEEFDRHIVIRATNSSLYLFQYLPVFFEKTVLICVDDYLPISQSGQGEIASDLYHLQLVISLSILGFFVLLSGTFFLAVYCLRGPSQRSLSN